MMSKTDPKKEDFQYRLMLGRVPPLLILAIGHVYLGAALATDLLEPVFPVAHWIRENLSDVFTAASRSASPEFSVAFAGFSVVWAIPQLIWAGLYVRHRRARFAEWFETCAGEIGSVRAVILWSCIALGSCVIWIDSIINIIGDLNEQGRWQRRFSDPIGYSILVPIFQALTLRSLVVMVVVFLELRTKSKSTDA